MADPTLTFREVVDSDWPTIADLINHYERNTTTGDILRQRNSQWNEGDPRALTVVTAGDGLVVGYSRSSRRQSEPPGIFRLNVYVDPSYTGKGLGRKLLEQAESFARDHGASSVMAGVEESCPRGIEFSKIAGYVPVQHLFESRLDLQAIDLKSYQIARSCLEDEGFRFTSMADEGDTDESWRRLWELDSETDRDVPGSEYWGLPTFEEYIERHKLSFGFSCEGILIAKWQDQYVGLNMVKDAPIEGQMTTDYTAVRREYRGKGIAQALKAMGIQRAIDLDAREMVTNNDERNAPMLAVNKKFGFVASPGYFFCKKELQATSQL